MVTWSHSWKHKQISDVHAPRPPLASVLARVQEEAEGWEQMLGRLCPKWPLFHPWEAEQLDSLRGYDPNLLRCGGVPKC